MSANKQTMRSYCNYIQVSCATIMHIWPLSYHAFVLIFLIAKIYLCRVHSWIVNQCKLFVGTYWTGLSCTCLGCHNKLGLWTGQSGAVFGLHHQRPWFCLHLSLPHDLVMEQILLPLLEACDPSKKNMLHDLGIMWLICGLQWKWLTWSTPNYVAFHVTKLWLNGHRIGGGSNRHFIHVGLLQRPKFFLFSSLL